MASMGLHMTTRKRLPQTVRGMRKALACLDRELAVRPDRFADRVTVEKSDTADPVGRSDVKGALKFGSQYVDLSTVLEWLTPWTDARTYVCYLHLHDGVVQELELFEAYHPQTFQHHLRLVHACPAKEGGSDFLGILDLRRDWILAIAVNQQDGFAVEFFGPSKMCQDLRSRLGHDSAPSAGEVGSASTGG